MCAAISGLRVSLALSSFKIVFADVIMGIARSEGALTSPCVVHVDDISIIDFFKEIVDGQASALASLLKCLGTPVKDKKHRPASRRQFVVGFWWDSVLRTRSLEEQKVLDYVAMFSEFASRRSLSLREVQSVAGRLQRAVLTLPPGASCLLANLFPLMRGLAKPHDKRRVPSSSRRGLSSAASLLSLYLQHSARCLFLPFAPRKSDVIQPRTLYI